MACAILAFGALLVSYVALELVFHLVYRRLFDWCFGGKDPVERLLPT